MNNVFENIAETIYNDEIKKWKSSGKKVIGHNCSYLPSEILYAAEILPVRMRGIGTENMDIGDAYFGPYICSFPKCMLQLAGMGEFSFYDGAVIIPGCDSMRRLDECWRKAAEDHNAPIPKFFYYFDVPHKIAPHGIEWFLEEITNLKNGITKEFNVAITDDKIREAISIYNRGRRLMKELNELRKEDLPVVTGQDAFSVSIAASSMPRDIFNERLEKFISTIKKKAPAHKEKKRPKRILLLGSANDDMDFITLIEQNNCIVVADNLCFGLESEGEETSVEGDVIKNLAERYLERSDCPRMFGQYKGRLESIKSKIEGAKVDGVIMQNIRFCDLHGSEHGIFERDLEKEGIPCLRLEREYGPLLSTGRLKMRIDAFIERIS